MSQPDVPVRLVLLGATGRMGAQLRALAADDLAIEFAGGIGRRAPSDPDPDFPLVDTPADAGAWLRTADVVVDFSAPEALAALCDALAEARGAPAVVVGTTGLDDALHARLDALAARVPVLVAANFSVGVNLLLALAETAAAALGPDYDVEIVEAHHRRKADAPSGTALALGEAVAAGRQVALPEVRVDGRSGRPGERPRGEIGFHALRGGDVVGEHRVHFLGERERIELAHVAADRRLFADGALRACKWIAGRPAGRYTMRDVLGLG